MSTPSPHSAPAAEPDSARWFADQIYVHDSALKSYLRSSYPDARYDLDDVVQESYLRIWKSRSGRPLASAKAFLFQVARHVTIDFLRRRRVSPIDAIGDLGALPVPAEGPGVAEGVSMDERVRVLVLGLQTLPPRGREIVVLRKLRGFSQKEVAAQLGISPKTVDEHLYRGLKRLGRFLRERGVCSHYEP